MGLTATCLLMGDLLKQSPWALSQREIQRRIKAGDLVLFLRCILTLCSIEQRAELRQRILERDPQGLMRVARAIVAKACRPEARWAFNDTDSGRIDH